MLQEISEEERAYDRYQSRLEYAMDQYSRDAERLEAFEALDRVLQDTQVSRQDVQAPRYDLQALRQAAQASQQYMLALQQARQDEQAAPAVREATQALTQKNEVLAAMIRRMAENPGSVSLEDVEKLLSK